MFSAYQEREEYEDELYGEKEPDDNSECDSDLEFRLYSQLHYGTDDLKHPENLEENLRSTDQETPQEAQPGQTGRVSPPDEVILIDSSSDVFTVSDNTEEEDSVCAKKGQRSKGKQATPVSQPEHRCQNEAIHKDVVVLDSDQSSDSGSLPPYVVDPDLDSDSDGLESWMILGREKEEGDQDIQLNILTVRNRIQPGECVCACVRVVKGGKMCVILEDMSACEMLRDITEGECFCLHAALSQFTCACLHVKEAMRGIFLCVLEETNQLTKQRSCQR